MPRKHVVTLISASPGVGKTTLAVSLAAVFAVERPVRLVAADPHRNGAAALAWPSSVRVVEVEENDPARLAALLEEPWEGLTLVDVPALPAAVAEQALAHCDLVLVPVSVTDLELPGVKTILDACARMKRRVLIVLSLVDPRGTVALRHAREAFTGLGAPLARNPFCHRAAYTEAATAHVPITTQAPSSIAVSEVRALANEITPLLR